MENERRSRLLKIEKSITFLEHWHTKIHISSNVLDSLIDTHNGSVAGMRGSVARRGRVTRHRIAIGQISTEATMALRRFIIERDIPKVGTFEREQLRAAAAKSNEVLHQLGPDIQWVESYVADNKTFCVYLAKDEDIIREHARVSGFPASKITEVKKQIDPTTAAA
jgi:hypothetical protein